MGWLDRRYYRMQRRENQSHSSSEVGEKLILVAISNVGDLRLVAIYHCCIHLLD